MLQFFKKAVSVRSQNDLEAKNSLVHDEYRKKELKAFLALQVKKLQKFHAGQENVIIDRNDEISSLLCIALEAIFLHKLQWKFKIPSGSSLKTMFTEGVLIGEYDFLSTLSFWEIVREVTHKDVITQLQHLVVTTDVGLCRAWLRLAVNDGLITSYLDAIISDKENLKLFYLPNAFLLDDELPGILKEILQGILHFEFHLNYNSSKLESWDQLPLQLAGHLPEDDDVTTEETMAMLKSSGMSNGQIFIDSSDTRHSTWPDKPKNSPEAGQKSESNEAVNSDMLNRILRTTSISSYEQTNKHSPIPEKNKPSPTDDAPPCTPTVHAPVLSRGRSNQLSGSGWSGWSTSFEDEQPSPCIQEEVVLKHDEKGILDSEDGIIHESEISHESKDNSQQLEGDGALTKDFHLLLEDYAVKNNEIEVNNETKNNEDQKMEGLHSPAMSDQNLIQWNFEVVPRGQPDQLMKDSMGQLTRLARQRGLDRQKFVCLDCNKNIGLIYGPYRVCYFDGGYYCSDCHLEEEHYIPAKILQNWDFTKYQVSKYNKSFLMKIEEEPLFHIDELNAHLYEVFPLLKKVKLLRMQLKYIKGYIQTCRHDIGEDFRRRLWSRDYLCDDIHQFSLFDLIQVQNGQLVHNLQKIINEFTRHIYKCSLCKAKGYICEFCNSDTVIFPFQLDTSTQCTNCLSVYHKICRKDKRCPKCVRIRLRTQSSSTEHRLSIEQTDHVRIDDIL